MKNRFLKKLTLFLFTFSFCFMPVQARYVVRPHPLAVFHNNQGVSFLQKNLLDKAIFEFKTAVEISPEYPEGWSNLGLAYRQKRDYAEAIRALNEATKLDPDYAGAWTVLGSVYHEKESYTQAIECYQRAIKANKKYADAYYNMGITYKTLALKLGQSAKLAKANESFRNAIHADPTHCMASVEMGHTYLVEGNLDDALRRFRVATETCPQKSESWVGLAEYYRQRKDFEKSLVAASTAVRINPENADAHAILGLSYLNQGNLSLAESELKRALGMNSQNQTALSGMAALMTSKGDQALKRGASSEAKSFYERALEQLTQLQRADSNNADLAHDLGYNYARLGDNVQAKTWFQKAVKLNPDHYQALLGLGILEHESGNTKEAQKLLCRVILNAPESLNQSKKVAQNLVGSCR